MEEDVRVTMRQADFVLMQMGKAFWNFITDHCAPQVELLVIVPTILF